VVEESVLQRVLTAALRSGGEFAEVYVEDRRNSGARLDDGKIEEFTAGRSRGAGIRVVSGNSTGYAHTSDLSERSLTEAARAAGAAVRGAEGRTTVVALEPRQGSAKHPIRELPETVEKVRKAEVLRRADDAARSAGGAIRQVSAAYTDARKRVLIANSDGLLVHDDRVRTRFMVSCTALGDGGLQTGYEGPGRTVGFELFDEFDPEEVARTAGGVLFHEACGHGLEADLVSRDASVFRGRVGTQVASPLVTLVDDGTFDRGWGTLSVDDEGHPARRNTLIENGVLSDYMWDLLRARQEGRESSGNGRRETYQSLPMVRMTNTYLLAGTDDPDDIIASTPYGLYCAALGGGQVNTATGDFVFGVTEAYLIENGRLTAPVRAANLIGNGPETLLAIDAVGSDFDSWAGTCGKDGQGVPVSAGQPTVRVAEMTVGGTAGE
jgi:TldD protein